MMIQAANETILRGDAAAGETRGREDDPIERWEDEGGGPSNRAGIDRRPPEIRANREPNRVRSTPAATGLACPVCGCEEGCLHRWADDGGPIPVTPGGYFVERIHATT